MNCHLLIKRRCFRIHSPNLPQTWTLVARWEWTPPHSNYSNDWMTHLLFNDIRTNEKFDGFEQEKVIIDDENEYWIFLADLYIHWSYFLRWNSFLLCLPILVACSMMHIMYITVRKHPQFLFFCCCSRNTTVGFREFISNGSSDAWRVTMESDPLLWAASWGALCFKLDFIAWSPSFPEISTL